MKIICPKCHEIIEIQLSGRAARNIPFTTFCKALQSAPSVKGRPNFSAAARYIMEKTGVEFSPSLVPVRLDREADARGIKRETLLAGILSGQVTGEPAKKYQG